MRRNLPGQYKKKKLVGYDMDVIIPRPQDAPFAPKKPTFHRFCAMWGCKFQERAWKRAKVFTRAEYLTMLIGIVPGIWYHEFNKYVIKYGAAHILQVALLALMVSSPLLYAETFFADYTKLQSTTFWRVMPITNCFLPMQIIGAITESVQGSMRSMIYLGRLGHSFISQSKVSECPSEESPEGVCFDNTIHTLSKRCVAGNMWVVCPDNASYVLPTHFSFKSDCGERHEYSALEMIALIFHWVVVAYISHKGLRAFVQEIMWTLLGVMVLHIMLSVLMLIFCGGKSFEALSILIGVEAYNFTDFELWFVAFVVAMDIASWGLPTNCNVAAGLLFRTNRWNDTALIMSFTFLSAIALTSANYSIIGCLATHLNARIEAIWKPHDASPQDVLINYFFHKVFLGPVAIALYYFSTFLLHLWPMAALAEAFVMSIAEACFLLDYNTYILTAYIGVCIPLSLYFLQYSPCDDNMDSDLNRAFTTIRILNGAAYSITLFWLNGPQSLADDHLFMYGSVPLGGILKMWRILPFIFLVMVCYDFTRHFTLKKPENKNSMSINVFIMFFAVTIISFIVIIVQHTRNKRPVMELFRPSHTLGPPNSRLQAARSHFNPHVGRGMIAWSRTDALERSRVGAPPPAQRAIVQFRRAAARFERREMERPPVGPPPPAPAPGDRPSAARDTLRYAEDISFFALMRAHTRR